MAVYVPFTMKLGVVCLHQDPTNHCMLLILLNLFSVEQDPADWIQSAAELVKEIPLEFTQKSSLLLSPRYYASRDLLPL